MPTGIVSETCPAPECNLSAQDVEQFVDEMTSYIELFAPAFKRAEQLRWSRVYLHGLLGEALRKNSERIALEMGETVRNLQYFIGQSPWKPEPAIKIHQGLVTTQPKTSEVAALQKMLILRAKQRLAKRCGDFRSLYVPKTSEVAALQRMLILRAK